MYICYINDNVNNLFLFFKNQIKYNNFFKFKNLQLYFNFNI